MYTDLRVNAVSITCTEIEIETTNQNEEQKSKQKKNRFSVRIGLTWISDDNHTRASEITVPLIGSFRIVVQTHSYRGMVEQSIRIKAGASFLYYFAIYLRTSEIDIH